MKSKYRVSFIAMSALLFVNSSGLRAEPVDVEQRRSNFLQIRYVQIMDDRCHAFTPEERHDLDTYVEVQKMMILRSDGRDLDKMDRTERNAQEKAAAATCETAQNDMTDVRNDRAANHLGLAIMPTIWAMDLGQRCKLISDEDNHELMADWLAYSGAIRKQGLEMFARYVAFTNQAADASTKFPCSDSAQLTKGALEGARARQAAQK